MKCDNCNSKFGYIRIKNKEWVCRNCGNIMKIITPKQLLKNFAGLRN